jgi:hypothetical protein
MKTVIGRDTPQAVKAAGDGANELLKDPGFRSLTDWVQGGTLLVARNGLAVGSNTVYNTDYLEQNVGGLVVGRNYKFALTVTFCAAGAGGARVEVVGQVVVCGDKTTPGTVVGYFAAVSTSHLIRLTGIGFTGTVSYVSMRAA